MNTMATMYFNIILHGLMLVNFGLNWLKCYTFSIIEALMWVLWDTRSWFHPTWEWRMSCYYCWFNQVSIQIFSYDSKYTWMLYQLTCSELKEFSFKWTFFLSYFGCYMPFLCGDKICFDFVEWDFIYCLEIFVDHCERPRPRPPFL